MAIIKDWKKEIFTIPNLLSVFRLVLIPIYVTIYLRATELYEHILAAGILAVSCLTDMVDGQIARKFNMISTVGKILDPIADKFTQLALTVCLSIRYPVLRGVLVLFLAKEFFQLIAALINLRRGKMLPGAILIGKICTTVLFISLTVMVLVPDIPSGFVNTIAIVDGLFLLAAFIGYILAFFGKHAKVEAVPE